MKTHTTKSLNKDCLLIESDVPEMYADVENLTFESEDVKVVWSVVGRFSELTDEDVEQLLDRKRIMAGPNPFIFFKDYQDKKPFVVTPLESFFSALEAEGIYLNGNPYEKPKVVRIGCANVIHKSKHTLWHEAEARTFDPKRTILMVKN